MSVLIMKVDAIGDVRYSRLHTARPAYSPAYRYEHNDPVSEENRRERNMPIIQGIVKFLREIEQEASNGFARKSLAYQIRTVEKRKLSVLSQLSEGDFYPDEHERIIDISYRMIDRKYAHFLKQPNLPN